MEFAVSRGADRKALIKQAGVASGDLEQPDNRVPLPHYVALLKSAAELCDDPAFALHFGEAVRMQDISIVGLICEAAETTAEVGRQLNRYSRLVVDEDVGGPATMFKTTRGKEGLWMEAPSAVFVRYPQIIEAEFARLVWNTRVAFASNPTFQAMRFPGAVHFSHDAPAHKLEYERVFGAPLVFGSNKNALLLDEAFLTLKQPPTNRYVFGILSERADALLRQLETAKTTRARVESLLIPILHTGDATMATVAGKMAVSRRTLQRRLTAEGVTFEKVLDQLRHKLALEYLNGRKASVNETAYLVGFSEATAFARAFKRWTGSSPRAFRTAQQAEEKS